MNTKSMHAHRFTEKSYWKGRLAARRAQQATPPRPTLCARFSLRTFWFLAGGVAVVCWTEKIGTKKHEGYSWAHDWQKLHDKRAAHMQQLTEHFGNQWASMHKDRKSRRSCDKTPRSS